MATHLLRTSLHSTQSVSQPISYLNIFGLAFGILHSVVQAHPFFGVSIIITVLVAHSNICPPVVISLPQRGDNNDHLKFQAVALQVVTKKGLVTTENQTRLIPASEKGKSIKDEISRIFNGNKLKFMCVYMYIYKLKVYIYNYYMLFAFLYK